MHILLYVMLISFIAVIPLTIKIFLKGYKPARFFLMSLVGIGIAALLRVLSLFGLFSKGSWLGDIYLFVIIGLIIFFSQALVERISLLRAFKEKAEKKLRKSEEQLALVVKGADLGTWDWDIRKDIIIHNMRWSEMLGINDFKAINNQRAWQSLVNPEDITDVLKRLNDHLNGVTPAYEAEYRMKHESGNWVWILDKGRVLEYDDKEQPIRAAGTTVDISQRKRAEFTQKIVFNIANAVLSTKDMNEFYEKVHQELGKLLDAKNFQVGLFNAENDTIELPYVIDEKDKYKEIPAHKTCSAYVINNKQPVLLKTKDVKELQEKGEIEIFGTPSKVWLGAPLIADEKVIGLIFVQSYEDENAYNENDLALLEFVSDQIAISITRKQAERELRDSEEKFRLYMENAHDGVMIVGSDYKFEYGNAELAKILGYPLEEIIGQEFTKFLNGESKNLVADRYRKRQNGEGIPERYEFSTIRRDGEERYVELSSTVTKDSKGNIKTIAHLLDITERKQAENSLRASENRYRSLFDTANDAIFIMSNEIFIDCNEQTLKMFGCTREQIIGVSPYEFSPELQPDGLSSKTKALKMIKAVRHGKPQSFEWKHRRLDGTLFDAEISLNLVELSQSFFIQAIVRDISSRKHSEDLLKVLNEAGMSMQNALTTQDIYEKVAATLKESNFHFTYFTYNEEEEALYPAFISYAKKIISASEKLAGMKVEELKVLKSSSEEFVRVVDKKEVVFVKNGQDVLKEMLPKPANLLGYQIAKLLNIPSLFLAPFIAEDKVEGIVSVQSDYLQESDSSAISVFVHQLTAAIKRAHHYEQAEKEIATRLEAEEALKNSEEFFRSIIENSNDVVTIIDSSGTMVYETPSHERVIGYPSGQLLNKNVFEYIHPEDRIRIEQQFSSVKNRPGSIDNFNARFKHQNGSWRYLDGTVANLLHLSSVNGITVNFRDITESRVLQDQLNQSQKMEAIGQLAGGVAHDFNNLLTVISGYTNLLIMNEDIPSRFKVKLEQIHNAAIRAESLTRQLLAFSRKQIVQPKVIDVSSIINDSIKMLNRLIGEDIKIKLSLENGLPSILADPHQFEQVLINLIVNARDAIQAHKKSSKKKLITIETKSTFLDKQFLKMHVGCREGAHVELAVSDTGVGMDKPTLEKIFEPFFTTKESGKGTGLGLSTVYGIVNQNQAYISVYSEPNRGTTFRIYWPVAEITAEIKDTKTESSIQKGNEVILLVEDEDEVRTFGEEALISMGYHVHVAENGKAALELIKKEKINPQLLVTDMIMPGMDGKELSDRVIKLLPKIKVIYSSGYTDDYIVNKGILKKGVHFLEKPYSISSISLKIREVLDNN